MKDIFHFSILNIKTFFKNSITVIFSIAIIIFCVTSAYCYKEAVDKRLNEYSANNASNAFVNSRSKLDDSYNELYKDYKGYTSYISGLNTGNLELIVDSGKTYSGSDPENYYYEKEYSAMLPSRMYSFPANIMVLDTDGSCFTYADVEEFKIKYPGEEVFLGEYKKLTEDGIYLTDHFLSCFGILPENYNEIYDRYITLTEKENGEISINRFKLCGIINSHIYYTNANISLPHIIIADASKLRGIDMSDPAECYLYYGKDYTDTLAMAKKMSVMGCEVYNSFDVDLYEAIEQQQLVTDKILMIVIWAIAGLLLVNLTITIYFRNNYYKKNSLMTYAVGCSRFAIFMILEIELVIEHITAVVISLIAILAGCHWFNILLAEEFEVNIMLSDVFTSNVYIYSVVGTLFILVLYGIICAKSFNGAYAVSQLNS